MKFLTAKFLSASAITGIIATQCEMPLVSNGKCIAKLKVGFTKVDCSSESVKKLKLEADGKLCFGGKGRKCLYFNSSNKGIRAAKKFNKRANFIIFRYDQASNSLVFSKPNGIENKYPIFDSFKQRLLKVGDKAGDVKCSNNAPIPTAAPTSVSNEIEIKEKTQIGYVSIGANFKTEFDLKLTDYTVNWSGIISFGNSSTDNSVTFVILAKNNFVTYMLRTNPCGNTSSTVDVVGQKWVGEGFVLNEWHSIKIEGTQIGVNKYIINMYVNDDFIVDVKDLAVGHLNSSNYCTETRRIKVTTSDSWSTPKGFIRDLTFNGKSIEPLES